MAAALNEKVTVTENGKRRQITKREAVIAQLVNKSAAAELRATKMLIDMLRDVEKKAEPAPDKNPFAPTDKEVVQQLIARLRRNSAPVVPGRLVGVISTADLMAATLTSRGKRRLPNDDGRTS